MKFRWAILVFGVLFATLVLAQVYGPGRFSVVQIRGDGSSDIQLEFFDDPTARYVFWDDSQGSLSASDKFGITGSTPTFAFFDAGHSPTQAATSFFGTGDGTDSSFVVGFFINGANGQWVKYEGSPNDNPVMSLTKNSNDMMVGYTGTTGSGYGFVAGDPSPMAGFRVPSNLYVANASSALILVSPDASCSKCTVDNSDVFTCTTVTCPTVSP